MIRLLGDDSRSYKTFVDIVIQVPASSERRLPGVHSTLEVRQYLKSVAQLFGVAESYRRRQPRRHFVCSL